jgi:long-chain acyl-CoA synthetase
MRALLACVGAHAEFRPHAIALADERGEMDYQSLHREVETATALLEGRRAGLLMENGAHWAVVDLALSRRGTLCVPMPGFFTDAQLGHLIRDADLDLVVTDSPDRAQALIDGAPPLRARVAGRDLWLFHRTPAGSGTVPAGTAKVTYTSGTTGRPKGVCLAAEAIERRAISLCEAVGAVPTDRALSLLPLATLLENIGGLYAPLYVGGRAQIPALPTCGLHGSSGLRPELLVAALHRYAPTTLILVPQLLKALVGAAVGGHRLPGALRLAAVGGAPISPALLEQARALGIPVYQGYGLSEAASVVCLNLPGAERHGSVGRPLPDAGVTLSPEGEVLVTGEGFLGYLGDEPHQGGIWPTGDLGYLDPDGFLHLTGRRNSTYATAFGRNLAPEWVEGELTCHPDIAQAAVFGEGRPFNAAVIVPRKSATRAAVASAVNSANTRLPDYARVARWVMAGETFNQDNGLASGSGAVRRESVALRFRDQIDRLYDGETQYVAV